MSDDPRSSSAAAPPARADTPLDTAGVAAPPRKNGELVFTEPWESRVFGMTLALHARGLFTWEEFRDTLIAEIARCERVHGAGDTGGDPTPSWRYYERWQAALETLLDRKSVCAARTLDARSQELAARPPGHDHG